MTPSVTTRPPAEQDDAFLFELFKSVRMPEFAHVPLEPAQLEMLMSLQYTAQKGSYGAQYPGGDSIVLLDGQPVGRIWLYRTPAEHLLVDIALMPQFRSRGIGAALLTGAIGAARAAGVRLCCSVAVNNPGSLRFHQRLGFQIVGQDEVYYEMAVEP
jgi:ribosomal protein S18 acetylase RimI-like enzyme